MSRAYRVGEKKDCGVVVSSTDGSSFSITNATFVYKIGATVISQGTALIDALKVYTPLAPTQVAAHSVVTFSITCQPLTSNGQPDTSKTTEIVMYDVVVKVTN